MRPISKTAGAGGDAGPCTAAYAETLRLAEDLAGIGRWSFDLKTRRIVWSDEVYRVHGVSRESFDPNLHSVIDAYHPDDQAELKRLIAQALATGEGYDFKLRLHRPADGAERIVAAKAMTRRGGDGAVAELFGVFQDVTELEVARRRLEDSEADFRLLAENATDVIARYGPDGVFTYLSAALFNMIGYRPEELIGHRTFEIIDPEDHARVLAEFQAYAKAGRDAPPVRIEYRGLHRDGRTIWVEAHPRAIFDAEGKVREFQDMVRDVTARKTAELAALAAASEARGAREALAESEARYRLLADSSRDVILRIAPDGTIRYCSPACRKWGYEPEDLVGRKTLSLVHPDDMPNAIETLRDCFTDRPLDATLRREYRVLCADGGYVWLEGNPSLVRDADGRTLEVVTSYRDVSARRRMEDDLAAARDAAEAAAQAKSEFLANMSHELRTPLTSIIGFAGLMREMTLPGEASRYVQRIGTASSALLALINDVLDFSKLEAGGLTLDPHPTDVAALVGEVCDLMSLQAASKGLTLTTDIGPGVDAPIAIDDMRLRQILNNLIGNAVKFTERGGVTAKVRIMEAGAERRMRLEIRDTGPGLTRAEAARLFNRFAQADASIGRRHGGSGLGLSICRQLATAMGGEIGVDSTPGEGSTFWVEQPAPLCEHPALPADLGAASAPSACAGARLLVVDDHAANRELVRALLTGMDLSLSEAANGTEAVEACLAEPFDLILMDMHMPDMDGLTATRGIRASSAVNGDTPIIALTAMTVGRDDAEMQDAGLDDVVTKPIDAGQFLAKVARWLEPGARRPLAALSQAAAHD